MRSARRWTRLAAGILLVLASSTMARAAETVDLQLVLLVDVSLSVDEGRYRLQRDGTAAAFANPALVAAIKAGAAGAISVAMLEFSDTDKQAVVVDWTRIASAADAGALANKIRGLKRSSAGLTGIGNALLAARDLFDHSPYQADRRVIDLSGDGLANVGPPVWQVRDTLVDDGITINGLPIMTEEPALEVYYREYIIGGPNAFVIPAQGLASFAQAMQMKLLAEVAFLDSASLDPDLLNRATTVGHARAAH
ncbi:MAG TPA: DUF1194 domain-containing protein [Stellaceae bacterium]|nr:DUF1194 domain-containing protein [Stellaceae bacterium]